MKINLAALIDIVVVQTASDFSIFGFLQRRSLLYFEAYLGYHGIWDVGPFNLGYFWIFKILV